MLLHRLEQGRLGLGRGAVDLVGQDDLREDRAGLKLEDAAAVGQLHDDVGADDVGRHQVGRELDAVEVEIDRVGQGPHQQRLAQARHALSSAWPPTNRQVRTPWTISSWPTITLPISPLTLFVRRAELLGAGFHRFGWRHRRSIRVVLVL